MSLSPHDQQVLADLNQALVADDPQMAQRLAEVKDPGPTAGRKRLPKGWHILAAEMATWIVLGTGIFLIVSFPHVPQLAQLGSALVFFGALVVMTAIVVILQRRTNGPSAEGSPGAGTKETPPEAG